MYGYHAELVLAWSWPVIGAAGAWLIARIRCTPPYLRFRDRETMVHARLLTLLAPADASIPRNCTIRGPAVMIEAHTTRQFNRAGYQSRSVKLRIAMALM